MRQKTYLMQEPVLYTLTTSEGSRRDRKGTMCSQEGGKPCEHLFSRKGKGRTKREKRERERGGGEDTYPMSETPILTLCRNLQAGEKEKVG